MQTAQNKKYYDLLRNEERKHRDNMSLKRSEEALRNAPKEVQQPSKGSTTRARKGTLASTGSIIVQAALDQNEVFIDPSEGFPKVLDPVAALHLHPHLLRSIHELSFPDKNISALHQNFLLFEHLEVLYLQRNRLAKIHHLMPPCSSRALLSGTAPKRSISSVGPRGCVRLRHLDVSFNLISNLFDTDIPQLAFLEHLNVGGNRLADLAHVCSTLKKLRFLHSLVLERNPVTNFQNYRSYMIHHIPQLTTLDHRTISDEERKEAAAAYHSLSSLASAAGKELSPRVAALRKGSNCSSKDSSGVKDRRENDMNDRGDCPNAHLGVAFGSSYDTRKIRSRDVALASDGIDGDSEVLEKKKPKRSKKLWDRSECVKLMEKKRIALQRRQEVNTKQNVEEAEHRLREMKRAHLGFHGLWSLCGSQMPLNEEEFARWNADLKKKKKNQLFEEEEIGSVSLVNPRGKGKNVAVNAVPTVLPTLQQEEPTTMTLPLSKVVPLLSVSTWNTMERPQKHGRHGIEPSNAVIPTTGNHQGVLFDAVLQRAADIEEKTAHMKPEWGAKSIPSAERLASIQQAVYAAGRVFGEVPLYTDFGGSSELPSTTGTTGGRRASLPLEASRAPGGPPFTFGLPSLSQTSGNNPNLSVPQLQLEVDVLRYLHERKSAMVPPPWEHVEHTARLEYLQTELQEHYLLMVRVFFTGPELQALESQFGTGEVLFALAGGLGTLTPFSLSAQSLNASFSSSMNNPLENPSMNTTANSKKRGGSKKVRSALPQQNDPGHFFQQDQLLLTMMSTALQASRRNLNWLGVDVNSLQGTSGKNSSGGKAAAAAAATASHSGVIGSYSEHNITVVLSLLREDSLAHTISAELFLGAMCRCHGVDVKTSLLVDRFPNGFASLRAPTNGSLALDNVGSANPAGGRMAGGALPTKGLADVSLGSSFSGVSTLPRKKGAQSKGAAASGEGPGNVSASWEKPSSPSTYQASFVSAQGDGFLGTPGTTEKALLSINNVLGALLGYIPFVESRVKFFEEECLRCATNEQRKAEASEWFTRKVQAEMHLELLLDVVRPLKEGSCYQHVEGSFDESNGEPEKEGDTAATRPVADDADFGDVPNGLDSLLQNGTTEGTTAKPYATAAVGRGSNNNNSPVLGRMAHQFPPQTEPSSTWNKTSAALLSSWRDSVQRGEVDTSKIIIPPCVLTGKVVKPVGEWVEGIVYTMQKKNGTFENIDDWKQGLGSASSGPSSGSEEQN